MKAQSSSSWMRLGGCALLLPGILCVAALLIVNSLADMFTATKQLETCNFKTGEQVRLYEVSGYLTQGYWLTYQPSDSEQEQEFFRSSDSPSITALTCDENSVAIEFLDGLRDEMSITDIREVYVHDSIYYNKSRPEIIEEPSLRTKIIGGLLQYSPPVLAVIGIVLLVLSFRPVRVPPS